MEKVQKILIEYKYSMTWSIALVFIVIGVCIRDAISYMVEAKINNNNKIINGYGNK